ncbi:cell division protein FtsA [Clostridium hydrogeniformans]|uniref:cell division protein FtsA n=1 Tax=Clostridium hydrogeniformans TaxID=349933 RepID=UPI00047FBD46|nr:cell division protein FtsA [Clostridium hydrogeniformans]
MNNNYIVGIDMGSSSIYGMIGKADKQGKLKILASTEIKCDGIKKGIVVNIDSVTEALRSCLEDMERVINLYIDEVFIGIPSSICRLVSNKGIIAISGEEDTIDEAEVKRVLDAAKRVSIGKYEKVIDIIPEKFIIDESYEIDNPLNMKGSRLEVDAKIVVANEIHLDSIYKCFDNLKVGIKGTTLKINAASTFILTKEDKRETIAIIDVGVDNTDIGIYKNGTLVHMNSFNIGGNNITGDIMYCTKVSFKEAEELKFKYAELGRGLEDIELGTKGEEYGLQGNILCDIIDARIEEILNFISDELKNSSYMDDISTVIIYGGGISQYKSLVSIGKRVISKPIYAFNKSTTDLENTLTINSLGIVKHVFNELKISYNKITDNKIENNETEINNKEKKPEGFMRKIKSFLGEYF